MYIITISADNHVEFVVSLMFTVRVRDTAISRIVMVVGFFWFVIVSSRIEVKFVILVISYFLISLQD